MSPFDFSFPLHRLMPSDHQDPLLRVLDVTLRGEELLPAATIGRECLSDDSDMKRFSVAGLLFLDAEFSKDPVVIYDGPEPFYWNPAMAKITGYAFDEILQYHNDSVDIMELLYGWSEEEMQKVKGNLESAKHNKDGYDELECTLRTKKGEHITIAWKTRFYGNVSVRHGSIETVNKRHRIAASSAAMQTMIDELMREKDEYTAGHIHRVTHLTLIVAKVFGYDQDKLDLLRIQAQLHDIGKRKIDDAVLKSAGSLDMKERERMAIHAGNGVIYGVLNNLFDYIQGMPHHSNFFSDDGNVRLSFESLVSAIKKRKPVNPLDFNCLVGNKIPLEARLVSIADAMDAIVSRRIYSSRLGSPIEDIITYLERELLDATGLVITQSGEIIFDIRKWRTAKSKKDRIHPACVEWKGEYYYPIYGEGHGIQFDPRIIIGLYERGCLSEEIKDQIRISDIEIRPLKIQEVGQKITDYENKVRRGEVLTEKDIQIYENLKHALEMLRCMS